MKTIMCRFWVIMCLCCMGSVVQGNDAGQQLIGKDFDPGIIQQITALGVRVEVLRGVGAGGNEELMPGLSFALESSKALSLVKSRQESFAQSGYQIFLLERGYDYIPDRVAVIKSRDPFDIIRVRKTFAYTRDLDYKQIILRLKTWDVQYGLRLTGAGYNWVMADLKRMPEDVNAFAREVVAVCPDVLLFKSVTVDQLAIDIKKDNGFFLQWK